MTARRSFSIVGAVRALALVLVLFAFGAAPALGARGHEFQMSFGEPGSGPGQLKEPAGVAVNEATGDVYVVDKGNDRVEYFSSEGAYLGQFNGSGELLGEGKAAGSGGLPNEKPIGRFSKPEGIAVDNACYLHEPRLEGAACESFDPSNGDVYVADGGEEEGNGTGVDHLVVDKYTVSGEYIGQITTGITFSYVENGEEKSVSTFRNLYGVAVGPAGELFVEEQPFGSFSAGASMYTNAVQNEFDSYIENKAFASILPGGFAVDSAHDLYAHMSSFGEDGLFEINTEGKEVAKVDNEPPTGGIAAELGSEDVYVSNDGVVRRYGGPRNSLIENLSIPGMHGTGVAVDSGSQAVFVADAAGSVHVFALEGPRTPTIESESISDVAGESASFGAEINPRGATTQYRFEYGPCATLSACATSAYTESAPVPDGSIGAALDFNVYSVAAHVQGLHPGTAYHVRVVAVNEAGGRVETVDGAERTFVTQPVGGALTLLDGREWEMVSPPDKLGANIEPISEVGVVKAAASGDAVSYRTTSPTELEPPGNGNSDVQVLSLRGPEGWSSRDIALSHQAPTGPSVGFGGEYRFFSEDLSLAVTQPFGPFNPGLSSEASEQTAFLRTAYVPGEINAFCQSSCYRPLVTGKPGYANVPSGTVFAHANGERAPLFLDGTPDLTHIVLQAETSLVPGGNPQGGLYEWSQGKLVALPGIGNMPERGGLSADGSRIVSQGVSEGTEILKMLDVSTGHTVQLDAGQGTGTSSGHGVLQAASSDDSRVFFTDGQKLTEDGEGGGLYECRMVEEASGLHCVLSDLTPPNGEEDAHVMGVLGSSEDGSYVYFVADGVLAQGAMPGTCETGIEAEKATCNLYVRHDGVTRLVGVLSGVDRNDWIGNGNLNRATARVSPNGDWVTFMSQRSLTGYDTRDALTDKPDEEVYLYDAAGSGHVVCASCNPTGARPTGVEYGTINDGLVGGDRVWEYSQGIAANIPGWTPYQLQRALYQSRYLSDGGRLFFNSSDALVPQDVNGAEDVYEYEPPGVGSCTSASATFSEASQGCVQLISSGTSAEESAFLDASATGGDVFFLTAAKLSPADYDTSLDVYDAHECTGVSPCLPAQAAQPPACVTSDACKPAPTPQPPIYGAPSSATFSGAGNVSASTTTATARSVKAKGLSRGQKLTRALRACQRKRAKARAACRRKARAKYGKSSKANANGRGRR